MSKTLTPSEVSSHSTEEDLYMIINGKVYDCTAFAEKHPAGEEVLIELAGKDATKDFEAVGHSEEAVGLLKDMFVADLAAGGKG